MGSMLAIQMAAETVKPITACMMLCQAIYMYVSGLYGMPMHMALKGSGYAGWVQLSRLLQKHSAILAAMSFALAAAWSLHRRCC
jgi:hypothetical protein